MLRHSWGASASLWVRGHQVCAPPQPANAAAAAVPAEDASADALSLWLPEAVHFRATLHAAASTSSAKQTGAALAFLLSLQRLQGSARAFQVACSAISRALAAAAPLAPVGDDVELVLARDGLLPTELVLEHAAEAQLHLHPPQHMAEGVGGQLFDPVLL